MLKPVLWNGMYLYITCTFPWLWIIFKSFILPNINTMSIAISFIAWGIMTGPKPRKWIQVYLGSLIFYVHGWLNLQIWILCVYRDDSTSINVDKDYVWVVTLVTHCQQNPWLLVTSQCDSIIMQVFMFIPNWIISMSPLINMCCGPIHMTSLAPPILRWSVTYDHRILLQSFWFLNLKMTGGFQ